MDNKMGDKICKLFNDEHLSRIEFSILTEESLEITDEYGYFVHDLDVVIAFDNGKWLGNNWTYFNDFMGHFGFKIYMYVN
jgi:hypothetical protein